MHIFDICIYRSARARAAKRERGIRVLPPPPPPKAASSGASLGPGPGWPAVKGLPANDSDVRVPIPIF